MIDVSEKAVSEFKKIMGDEQNKGLSIKIKAHVSQSCCSCGPSQSYEMGLVEAGDDGDRKIDVSGLTFYIDDDSIELMSNTEVDFMDGQGFIVKDKSAPSCGCGGADYGHGHDHGGGSCCG